MTSTIVKQKMFRYIENKDRTFLFGAYRGEKSQLEWILGEKTQRYEKLYNIRFNQDLFSQRNGGTLSKVLPDYILTSNPQPIGFSGILLAKRQNSFYCTYFLHNRNVADTKSPYPIKRLEVIRWFNQKSMVFNQSLS